MFVYRNESWCVQSCCIMREIYTIKSDMDSNSYGKAALQKESKPQQEAQNRNDSADIETDNHPHCLQNLKHYLWEFCSRTTMHGFNYLGERGRTIPERIWWLITILISFYLCISLIIQTYTKWVNSPVIVTFATSQTPLWKIPFPAVTVCSEVKSRRSRFNYTDIYLKKLAKQSLTEKEALEFDYMSLICDTPTKFLNKTLATVDERAMDFLVEVGPDMKGFIYKVSFLGKQYDPSELFSPVLTNDGVCYTFNLMDRSEIFKDVVTSYKNYFSTNGKRTKWNIETGYSDDAEIDSYPRRTLVSGVKGGLEIVFIAAHEDLDYTCGDSLQGFKVSLHHPMEVPRGRQRYFRVDLDKAVIAAIKPTMMTTSKELKNYKPDARNCYFIKERSLKFFTIYNQPNCLYECLMDFTLERCGCVGFHMQRENTTPICSAYKEKCVVEARASYLTNEVNKKIEALRQESHNTKEKEASGPKMKDCHCLPTCTTLDFDVETSEAEWDWRTYLEVERLDDDWDEEDESIYNSSSHFSRLLLYFKDMQFVTSERNELYGQTDFWASCGGLLGLFVGFSFISALEIVYYLTLRIICNIQKFGRSYWSGAEELLEKRKKIEENEDT